MAVLQDLAVYGSTRIVDSLYVGNEVCSASLSVSGNVTSSGCIVASSAITLTGSNTLVIGHTNEFNNESGGNLYLQYRCGGSTYFGTSGASYVDSAGCFHGSITGDAASVAGFSVSSSNVGNTVVARNSSGYIYASYYNQSSGVEDGTLTYLYYDNGDGWHRKTNLSYVKQQLGAPYGFSSWGSSSTWGNTTGTSFATWNDSTGGSIEFRRDNPSSGKMSLKVDGRVYVSEGGCAVMGMCADSNGYWGMGTPDGDCSAWLRVTSNGLLPYQSGSVGSGHSALGTSTWYFGSSYIDNMNSKTLTTTSDITVNGLTVGTGNNYSVKNTAIGACALYKNTSGLYNVAIGACALCANTSGRCNIAIGYYSNPKMTSVSDNISIGSYAGCNMQGGSQHNIAIGSCVLKENVSGSNNIAIGTMAGYNYSYDNSIFIGNYSNLPTNITSSYICVFAIGPYQTGIIGATINSGATSSQVYKALYTMFGSTPTYMNHSGSIPVIGTMYCNGDYYCITNIDGGVSTSSPFNTSCTDNRIWIATSGGNKCFWTATTKGANCSIGFNFSFMGIRV